MFLPISNKSKTVGCFLIILIIKIVFIFQPAMAQNNIIDYTNPGKYLFYNPSVELKKCRGELSVFPLTSTDFELSLPVSLNDLFQYNKSNSAYVLNLARLTEKVGNHNLISGSATIGYFSYVIRRKSVQLGFQLYDNIYGGLGFERNLVELIDKGNMPYISKNFTTRVPFYFTHYSTLQFSLSRYLTRNLRIGLSSKLYFGKAAINSSASFSLYTDSLVNYLDFGLSGNANIAAPLSRSLNGNGNVTNIALMNNFSLLPYLFQFKNPGLGLDIGMQYNYSNRLNLSASIIDLGFIFWSNHINSISINGNYRWDGIDLTRLIKVPTDTSFMNGLEKLDIADSILFSALHPSNNKFVTLAPLKFYIAANYKYNNRLDLSFTNRLFFYNKLLSESFVVSGNYSLTKNWNFSSGLGFSNRSFLNLPVGLSYKNEKFHVSLSVSNLWGIFVPSFSRCFGAGFSAVLTLDGYTKLEKKIMDRYPFYRIYKRWMDE